MGADCTLCVLCIAASPVIPINDIRGVETLGYTKQEKVLRCKLAACYRLVDLFGWTHGIFNHISVSVLFDLCGVHMYWMGCFSSWTASWLTSCCAWQKLEY